jgi:hypothetical protein
MIACYGNSCPVSVEFVNESVTKCNCARPSPFYKILPKPNNSRLEAMRPLAEGSGCRNDIRGEVGAMSKIIHVALLLAVLLWIQPSSADDKPRTDEGEAGLNGTLILGAAAISVGPAVGL